MAIVTDKRYDAVLAAIKGSTEAASLLGWQGYEIQAHVFLAAFAAASGEEPVIGLEQPDEKSSAAEAEGA